MSLFEIIAEEIETDDVSYEKKSAQIIALWHCANQERREVMDSLMMSLCGWSLTTLIKNYNEETGGPDGSNRQKNG